MEESSNEANSRSPQSNSEGPLTPPRTPYEPNFRLEITNLKKRVSALNLPHSTSDCTVSSSDTHTNFDMSEFNCSEDMIPQGGLESSELDQYLPGEVSYVGPSWFNRSEPSFVNTEKDSNVSTTNDFPHEEKASPPVWQHNTEERKKKNSELTKLTTLAPSVQPSNFSTFFISRSETISANEEDYSASNYYPTNYSSYPAGCLPAAYPYWSPPQQPPVYNFMNYSENCWQN